MAINDYFKKKGLNKLVAGGGVAANSYLRAELAKIDGLTSIFPPLELCTDNAAMVAGLAYHYLKNGKSSDLSVAPQSKVQGFSKKGRVKK